jgi:Zn-dependent peptidase ImmA (M78 family)/transcriptional regulator with XRE-family HTH domain
MRRVVSAYGRVLPRKQKMNKAFNGELLMLARQTRKVSQAELVSCLNGAISQAQLSKLEHGHLQPDERLVERIAEALKYKPSFFYNSVYQRMDPISFHRKRKKLSAKDREAIHGQSEIYRINLKRLLPAVELETQLPPVPVIDPDQYNGDIPTIALTLRQRWGIPRGPIRDLTKLVEDAGVIVIAFDFGTPLIDGFCQHEGDDLPPVVFINVRQPKDRYRFSLAHELGHLIMHQTPNPEQEVQANIFASEFLMPTPEIRSQFYYPSINKFMELKLYWGTSMQALIYKAWQIGRISDRMFKYYNIEMSKRGFKTKEPVDWNGSAESASTLRQLLATYVGELGYSISDLSELFGLLEDEVVALYELSGKRRHLKLVV